jgi:hypothetical protein
MTAALEGGEWSTARPGHTLPPGKTRYPLYWRLGGPQGRSGRTENLAPSGFNPRIVQPVAHSLYRLSYPAHSVCTVLIYVHCICAVLIYVTVYVLYLYNLHSLRTVFVWDIQSKSQNLSGETNIYSGNQIARLVGKLPVDQAYRVYNCPPLEPVVSSWMQSTPLHSQPSDPFWYSCQVFCLKCFLHVFFSPMCTLGPSWCNNTM